VLDGESVGTVEFEDGRGADGDVLKCLSGVLDCCGMVFDVRYGLSLDWW